MRTLGTFSGAVRFDKSGSEVKISGHNVKDASSWLEDFEKVYKTTIGSKPDFARGYPRLEKDGKSVAMLDGYRNRTTLEDFYDGITSTSMKKPIMIYPRVSAKVQYPRAEEMTVAELYESAQHDETFRLPEDLLR